VKRNGNGVKAETNVTKTGFVVGLEKMGRGQS
jgi:hypothetical protein